MDARAVLIDAVRRPLDAATAVLGGIDEETLHTRPGGTGSSIAWLVWHAARQQDLQVAELTGSEQVWTAGSWADRLGVHRPADQMGFGDSEADVAALHVTSATELGTYLTEVVEATVSYVNTLTPDDLDEVVDTSWDPPVTRGVRLVSVIDDAVAHLGQAAYVRGIVAGWSIGY